MIAPAPTEAPAGPIVVPSLSVIPVSRTVADLTALPPSRWTEQDIYIYVREEMTRIHGEQLPSVSLTETMREFCGRFGTETAVRIVRAAFEIYGGMWQGAPVTIKRFLPSHDGFFALPLLAHAQDT